MLRLTDEACCPDCPGIPGPGTAAAMPPLGERDSSELKPLNAYPACACIKDRPVALQMNASLVWDAVRGLPCKAGQMSLVYGHFTIQGHRYVNWHGGNFSSYLLLHYGLIREPLCLGSSLLLQRLVL